MQPNCLRKESFGAYHIARLAEADIDQIAISINASIKITQHTLYSNERFVDQPDLADFAFPFRSDL